jgi:hypothetical protein
MADLERSPEQKDDLEKAESKPECYDCDADTDDGEWKARHTNKPPCRYAEDAPPAPEAKENTNG